ncbi:hypothetical protein CF105_01420 [Aeromonas veronii]|nr:hypothetical protein CF105_01420 [Aeromonas veronii]
MGDLRVGSLWVSVKLAIGLQYLESSIFSVASGYRLATLRANQPLRAVNKQKKAPIFGVRGGKLAYQQVDIFT